MVTGFLFCQKRAVFPYFFPYQLFIEQKDEVYPRPFFMPLCLFDAVDERLHTSGALFFHALGNMAVHIQRKGRRSVAEISLHRFHVVAVLQREHGERVTLRYNYDKPEKHRISIIALLSVCKNR